MMVVRKPLRLTLLGVGVAAFGLVAFAVSSDPVFFAGTPPTIAQSPLYMRDSVPPLNMLVIGKDHKIYYEAYNDASDLDGDGIVDVGYRGWELKSPAPTDGSSRFKIDYYGYFNSYACYDWKAASQRFEPVSVTADKTCSGKWSGDYLNYLTTSRMDALRRVLYGGWRQVDTDSETVLQGAFFPQDAHSWGKEYQSVERDGYDIRKYTPLTSLPAEGRQHLFAVTTLKDSSAGFPGYQAPVLRTLRNSPFRVWNWVSMEGPVAGTKCFSSSNERVDCVQAEGSTHPGHPQNRADFDVLERQYATDANKLGSAGLSNINCSSACNPFGGHDNYLTIIEGDFVAGNSDGDGQYEFAVDGDDAVDFEIFDRQSRLYEAVGWYGGHGACSTCLDQHKTNVVSLSAGETYRIRFRHEEASGGDSYALYYRKRTSGGTGGWSNWSNWAVVPDAKGLGKTGLSGLTISTYDLSIATTDTSMDPDRPVRVLACPAEADLRDSTCKSYPRGSSKPTGILHDYGESQKMYFGLITGTQANNLQGGVLRRNISKFTDEVNSETGVFKSDVEGVVRNIDRLRMIGGGYAGNVTDNTTADKNWNWANFAHGVGGNCTSQGDRAQNNGECRMWGNPIAEMMFEAMRYFAGAGAATSAYSTGGSAEGRAEDVRLGLSTPVWKDPYAPLDKDGLGLPSCSRPVQTVISDINPSYDGDLPGSAFATVPSDVAVPGFNAVTEGQAIWDSEFGGARSVFIGETLSESDGAPTAKIATSFGDIRGLAPEEPTKQGTYYSAAVARYAAQNRLNSRADDPYLTTFAVALASPLPRMEVPVGGRVVELLPFAKTVSGTFGDGQRKPTNTIVDFYVEEMINFHDGARNTSVNGGRPYAVFRISYEDVEQGNDHDMDMIVRYEIKVNSNNTLTVDLSSEYASGSANQNAGYVVSGTTKDGVYLEVRDSDSTQSNSVFELNTPEGKWAGDCINQTHVGSCSVGLTLRATRTFTVGDAGVGEQLRDPLWYAAKYGTPASMDPDANDDGEPDNYFLVTNPLNMRAQLAKAFDSAAALDIDAGNSTVSGARVGNASFTLQPTFRRERNGNDWTGNLTALAIKADGSLGNELWNAAANMPSPDARKIIAVVAPGTKSVRNAKTFTYDSLRGASDDSMVYALLGIDEGRIEEDYGKAYTARDFVHYLRGGAENEEGSGGGGTLRSRSSLLGDIVNSEPVVASSRSNYGYSMYSDAMFEGYQEFLEQKRTGGRTFAFVGANDGMLHAFNADTRPCGDDGAETCAGTGAGKEVFAFVPHGVLRNLGELALPDGRFDHRYYVDGQLTVADANDGGEWKTLLVGTTAAGGRSVFVLDVTDADGFGTQDVLWELNGSVDLDIGHTYGKPLLVPLENGKWGVLFGNGYGGNTSDPSLYIRDAFSGEPIAKLTGNDGHPASGSEIGDRICAAVGALCAFKTDPFNGLGPITAIDKDGNGRVDTVYGGDLQGNVWKFDLSAPSSGNWTVANNYEPLFTAEVGSGDGAYRQPITGGIRVAAGPGTGVMVFFGTGRYLFSDDNRVTGEPDIQTLYGIFDNGSSVIGGRSVLTPQYINAQSRGASGQLVRSISQSSVPYHGGGARRGWYIDLAVNTGTSQSPELDARGERFIATPSIQSGRVFFTTYTPLDNGCNPGGTNFVYGLDLLSGAGALSNLSVLPDGEPVCADGACGAVSIDGQSGDGEGGRTGTRPPVMDTGIVAIKPVKLVDPTCTGTACATYEECSVVMYPGGFVLPRPCGRQSWRQLR